MSEIGYNQFPLLTGITFYEQGDVSISNGDSLAIKLNGPEMIESSLFKRTISLKAKGILASLVSEQEGSRKAAVDAGLSSGTIPGVEVSIFGLSLNNVYVAEVTPSNIMIINGQEYGDLDLVFKEGKFG